MKKAILGALFAGAMLASCSNDDSIINGGDPFDGDQAFVKVRIAMADNSGHGTRATEDGGYVNGTETEQKVYSLGFKFYNTDGSFYGYGETINNPTTNANGNAGTTGQNVEAFVDATVVLKVAEGGTKPAYVVTYVNCDNYKAASESAEPNMSDISATATATYDVTTGDGESAVKSKRFRMTTSNYRNLSTEANAKDGYATPVSPDKFYESAAAATAENNYVDIYVERLAAKVTVAEGTGMTNATITRGDYTLDFTVKGFQLGGINTSSYLIKNLDDSWNATTPWANWQNTDHFRSFWAKDANYTYAEATLDYAAYNEIVAKGTDAAVYCDENTFAARGTSTINRYKVQPFAYVMGAYTVEKNGTPVTDLYLYDYAGGIYTQDDMIDIMQSAVGKTIVYKQDATDNTKYEGQSLAGKVKIVSYVDANDVTDASRVMLQLKNNADLTDLLVKNPDAEATEKYIAATTENVNNALKNSKVTAVGFKYDASKGGYLAYFPVLIEHLNYQTTLADGKTQPVGAYGIVRNHVYQLTITKITNLGIGVFDPTVDIIPDDKVKEYYLGAKINILSWKVVKQTVEL